MFLTLVLLAQVVTATPSPRPVFVPSTLGANPAPPVNSLSGAARGRKIHTAAFASPVTVGTPQAAKPVSGTPAIRGASDSEKEEVIWKERAASLRQQIADLQREAYAIESQVPATIYYSRGGGGSYIDDTARQAASAPTKAKLLRARQELAGLPEECRKAGCQPGWIR